MRRTPSARLQKSPLVQQHAGHLEFMLAMEEKPWKRIARGPYHPAQRLAFVAAVHQVWFSMSVNPGGRNIHLRVPFTRPATLRHAVQQCQPNLPTGSSKSRRSVESLGDHSIRLPDGILGFSTTNTPSTVGRSSFERHIHGRRFQHLVVVKSGRAQRGTCAGASIKLGGGNKPASSLLRRPPIFPRFLFGACPSIIVLGTALLLPPGP